MRNIVTKSLLMAVLSFLAPLSYGAIHTFDLTYSGAQFGNTAVANGSISFDATILPAGPAKLVNVSAATLGVVDWSLTVSGAITGNGAFGLADLQLVAGEENGWIWDLGGPINLMTELVGQAGFSDFNWCGGTALSCGNPLAPGGSSTFTITTSGETGDSLFLTSMTPSAVPEPETWAMLLAGLGLVGAAVRRRKQAEV